MSSNPDPRASPRPLAQHHRPGPWLWLTTVADVDGPGRALSAVLSAWTPHDVVMVCALRTVSASFRRAIPDSIETIALNMRGDVDARALYRLVQLCRRRRPNVIHTSLSRADWIGRPLARMLGIPVVSTIHNLHSRMYAAEFPSWLARIGCTLDRRTLPMADRVVAVSRGVREDVAAAHGRHDAIVIRNGIDLRRLSAMRARADVRQAWGIPTDTRVVGTVSGLKIQKGIPHLIDAAARVSAADPRALFLHIGAGPLAGDTAARIDRAGLHQRFRLLGHLESPIEVLAGFDLFVMPSLWEGFPIALMEAMAAGLPAVGTRVSGIEDLIEDGGTGLLVPPADAPALADAILSLLDDDTRRAQFGHAARARAAHLTGEVPAAAYRQLFAELAQAGRAPVRLRRGRLA